MERFVRTSVEDLELLFVAGGCDFESAAYPPACDPPGGRLCIRLLDAGGVKIEVEPRGLETGDFRLDVLFHGGSCVFAGAEDVAGFFRGPVADAFGIEAEPIPERPQATLLDDLQPRVQAAGVTRSKRASGRKAAPRSPRGSDLAALLALEIHGQEAALARIADVVSTHLAKSSPARPESVLLVGPTGTGKTSTVEALPAALGELGRPGMHVFRVDCNELVYASDIRRFFGAPPSYIGYVEEPPLFAALRKPGCIVLLDEVEKAAEAVRDVFLGLLDEGRVTAPDGDCVEAPGAIMAMTSNVGADDLLHRLRDLSPGARAEQAACREHLLQEEWPAELVGRIGSFAVFDPLSETSLRGVAENAIHALAREFGLEIEAMSPVLADVVLDLADASEIGARALGYAARDLLVEAFADAAREGVRGPVSLDAGPPPRVVAGCRSRH